MSELRYNITNEIVICCFCKLPIDITDDVYHIEVQERKPNWGEINLEGSQICHIKCLPSNCRCLLFFSGEHSETDRENRKRRQMEEKLQNICPDCGQQKYGNWMQCPTCAKELHKIQCEEEPQRKAQKRLLRNIAKKDG